MGYIRRQPAFTESKSRRGGMGCCFGGAEGSSLVAQAESEKGRCIDCRDIPPLSYPYYAIFSKMKEHLLTPSEMKAVERLRNSADDKKETVVFTIGYEGILFEEYLNKLLRNRVVVLCDVRRNPVSRKFGFPGRMLSQVLPKIGIKYVHFPELGIESEKRQNLNSREAYNDLFYEYRQDLSRRTDSLALLKQQIDVEKRVALTCFEKDPHLCHRHCITDLLKSEFGYRIEHL